MGEVYKAHDPVLNRFVAIKVISESLVSDDQLRQRFLQEARSAAQLNHRNITTVFEFVEEPGQVFLVMEFLEGSDLREVIARRALRRIEDKLGVIEQVCDALAYAHGKGIIHRDLKPANIRVLPNQTPKIMDFGLARLGASEITRAGTVMGTPDYMSPEQVRAEKVDARADVFSVGAVLYHLLSSRKPFEAPSVSAILYEVLEREPPRLQDLVPDLPPLVPPIVERALRKDPARRYQSAADLRDALRDARRALAAGRAAVAAMTPSSEGEATITRLDGLTPTYVSLPPRTASSFSVAPPAAPMASPSPPTVAMASGALTVGATALELPAVEGGEESTEHPAATFVGEAVHGGRRHLVLGVAAFGLLLLIGVGVSFWYAARQTERQRQVLTYALAEQQLETARNELANKAYAQATAEAEAVLARGSGNREAEEGAREVLARANAAVAALEEAALETRAAFDRRDLKGASDALSRVLALDPRHAVAVELGPALKGQFESRVEQARSQAATARRAAEGARAGGHPVFAEADRLARQAEAQASSGEYLEATRMLTQAGDTFDRARRETLLARAAEEKAAQVAAAAAAARVTTLPAPPLVAARPSAASAPPSVVSATPPPALPPSVAPSLPALPPPAGAPGAAAALPPEPAVRRALADYVRAMEGRNLDLFKTVMPGMSADEEKRLRDNFKRIKSHAIQYTIEQVAIESGGTTASVRVSRRDTVDGQSQPARQQTFRLVQRGSTWVIDSIGR